MMSPYLPNDVLTIATAIDFALKGISKSKGKCIAISPSKAK